MNDVSDIMRDSGHVPGDVERERSRASGRVYRVGLDPDSRYVDPLLEAKACRHQRDDSGIDIGMLAPDGWLGRVTGFFGELPEKAVA